MPKITVIETGLLPPKLRQQHGSFPEMFERMIAAADSSATFETVRLAEGETLPDPAALQAILITGSAAGVYDDLDWIAPLESFVRAAYDKKVSMVGVCFGHQMIAQALGGTVRKSENGWGIGRHVYDVAPGRRLSRRLPDCFTATGQRCPCSRIRSSRRALRMPAARSARAKPPTRW